MTLSQIIILSLDPTSDRTKTLIARLNEKLADANVEVGSIEVLRAADYEAIKKLEHSAKVEVFDLLHQTNLVNGDFSRREPDLAIQALSHIGVWSHIERQSIMTALVVDDTLVVEDEADFSILKRIPASTDWDIIALDSGEYALSGVTGSPPTFVKELNHPSGAYIIRGPSIKKLRAFLSPLVAPLFVQLHLLSRNTDKGGMCHQYRAAVDDVYGMVKSPYAVHCWNKLFSQMVLFKEPDLFEKPMTLSEELAVYA